MISRKKIRIFDDEQGFRQDLKAKVEQVGLKQDEFDIDVLSKESFDEALGSIEVRQKSFREQGIWEYGAPNPLDDVSILIVDYDLFETHAFLTADRVAYLARCFTTCDVIVVLNRSGHNPFDLTLKDRPESFADLDIGQAQLDNPFLWGLGQNEFAPWSWPVLPKLAADYAERIRDVEHGLEAGTTVWEVLGFSEKVRERLPLEITRFMDPSGENGRLAHFMIESNYGLESKDRGSALIKDRFVDPKIIARIAAARIGKWLEYVVLPELDILMDAPHLISRLPGLMGNIREIADWNSVAIRHLKDMKDMPKMKCDLIEEFRFKKAHWLSRPTWFWRDIIENANIDDVRAPWKIERPEFVFCEDTSLFHPQDECREFQAQTRVSPFSERYIHHIEGVDYMPRTRLAM